MFFHFSQQPNVASSEGIHAVEESRGYDTDYSARCVGGNAYNSASVDYLSYVGEALQNTSVDLVYWVRPWRAGFQATNDCRLGQSLTGACTQDYGTTREDSYADKFIKHEALRSYEAHGEAKERKLVAAGMNK
eukprot:scaffold1206_cov388-Prasinococcus_capsulatus_cf.AAC.14